MEYLDPLGNCEKKNTWHGAHGSSAPLGLPSWAPFFFSGIPASRSGARDVGFRAEVTKRLRESPGFLVLVEPFFGTLGEKKQKTKKYFASSNPHPPHSQAYDRYNKLFRILETSTPNSNRPFWTVSKTILASCSGGILAGSTGEYWRATDTRQDPPARDQRDTWRDPLAGWCGGMLASYSGGIHW